MTQLVKITPVVLHWHGYRLKSTREAPFWKVVCSNGHCPFGGDNRLCFGALFCQMGNFLWRSEGLQGWFAHFFDQFGDVKKKFKLGSNWIEVKMIGASWRHFVPEPFWPLWNRPDLESAPISSFSNRWLQASRRWEPRSFDVTSIWCIALMTNYLVTK